MTPEQYCKDKTVASGSSFVSSFRFLPDEQRRAMTALYAFCREVDDIVDECSEPLVALAALDWWRADIARLYQGQPEHPVQQALQPHVKTFDLPQEWFIEIIDGMQMDLEYSRYPRFSDLLLYCHRVAGVVGQLSAQIFGYRDRATLKYAHELGIAFQLTNITRDVGEDARRGRIYLPLEELEQFGVTEADILSHRETDAIVCLLAFQVTRAEQYYQQAWALLPAEDRKAQRVGLVMAAIYRATLAEIKRDGVQNVMNQRLSLTPMRKLWLAWTTWTFGYRP